MAARVQRAMVEGGDAPGVDRSKGTALSLRIGTTDMASPAEPIAPSDYPTGFAVDRRPVAVLGLDHRIQAANGAFVQELGISHGELVGAAVADLWELGTTDLAAAIAEGFADTGTCTIEAGPAPSRPTVPAAVLQFFAVTDPAGCGVGVAMTAIPEAAQRVKRAVSLGAEGFQLSFEQLAVGMLLTGMDGYALACNPTMATLLGRTLAEIADTLIISMLHPGDCDRAVEQALRLLSHESDGYS
jgi:PAS domain-containing protein